MSELRTRSLSHTHACRAATWGRATLAQTRCVADTTAKDYHLKSAGGRWTSGGWVADTVTSPCVDAGDPANAYANEPSPNGGRINIGAYGNTTQASKTPGSSYTVTFTVGTGGTLSGISSQAVQAGKACTAVTAVPNTGYKLVNWTGTNGFVATTANPLTVSNVIADMAITANFAANTYTLTYTAGANGTIMGSTPQTVNYGASGTAVTAVPLAT